jgi:SNF2 family DNA or RNA helicase
MVRVLKSGSSAGKITVSWNCKDSKVFYKILGIVKSFIGAFRKGKNWIVNVNDLSALLEQVRGIEGQTIHIDLDIFPTIHKANKITKALSKLRDTLTGVDSGVQLANGYNLLPFQHVGVKFISLIKNGIIADKVGLGKTIQGIGVSYKLIQDGKADKAIFIVPSTLKVKWRSFCS